MSTLNQVWYNFTHFNQGRFVQPPVHFFFMVTFFFGMCFVFFPDPMGASQTFLYQETTIHIAELAANLWGVAALTTCLAMVLAFQFRLKWFAKGGCALGFMVWLYAGIMYILGGYPFGLLVAAVPNILFWIWLYLVASDQYRENHEAKD